MLRDELLVRLLRLPRVERLLHRAGEAVLVADDEVPAVERWILRGEVLWLALAYDCMGEW